VATVGYGPLNGDNLRDAAVDLPNLDTGDDFIVASLESEPVGPTEAFHILAFEVLSSTSGPPTPTPLEDASTTETNLVYSGGLSVAAGDILRVYWNLSVSSEWSVSDPLDPDGVGGAAGSPYQDDPLAVGRYETSDWCWVIHLEWDITSSSLSNWDAVPGQADFQSTSPIAAGSGALSQMEAASVVEAFSFFRNGTGIEVLPRGWRPATGGYFREFNSPVTIYGLRLVVSGVYKAYKAAGGGATLNYLVLDPAVGHADTKLLINHGCLTAMLMKGE
jgi:hypothetical protein